MKTPMAIAVLLMVGVGCMAQQDTDYPHPDAVALNDSAVVLLAHPTFPVVIIPKMDTVENATISQEREQQLLFVLDLLEQAIDIEPDYGIALYNLLNTQEELGLEDERLKTLDRLIEVYYNSPPSLGRLAMLKEGSRQQAEAMELYKRADSLYQAEILPIGLDSLIAVNDAYCIDYGINLIMMGKEQEGVDVIKQVCAYGIDQAFFFGPICEITSREECLMVLGN